MRVFHGSAIEVKEPEIRIGKFTKDFGEGFYCTKLKRQAQRWAMRKETPTISIYEYTPDKTLSICDFKTMTDEWLDFIGKCRNGYIHDYDIVEGPMADDTIWNFVNDFLSGNISREVFWEYARFKYPTHQISFHSMKALSCLKFERSEQVGQ